MHRWAWFAVACIALPAQAQDDDDDVGAHHEAVCCGFICCLIEGVCRADGDLDPRDPCRECNPVESQSSWSVIPGCGAVDAGGPVLMCATTSSCFDDRDCPPSTRCNGATGTCWVTDCGGAGDPCSDDVFCGGSLECVGDRCTSSSGEIDAGMVEGDAGDRTIRRYGCGCRAAPKGGASIWLFALAWLVARRRR
jgi:MYXO-CTERM domain-containing protein